MNDLTCPECGSACIYKSKKFDAWICEDCGKRFDLSDRGVKWNDGLLSSDYWCTEFYQYAPSSLSHSYRQLMHYVEEGNIGCTLFLIRDVFELMIKIPTVILFDSIYSLFENCEDYKILLENEPKLESLYRNSMQILTTGKWWECVRLGAGLSIEKLDLNVFDEHRNAVLSDTVSYLKQIFKLFTFQVPGKQKVNMVTWRNRAVGHSCLASKPEESYPEIPYILKMFKKTGEESLPYYKKICFANSNKELLAGIASGVNVEEVFISYQTDACCHFFKIHDFAAGRNDSISYYDGYEKGKAYLLDYGDGNRYKDAGLSKIIMSAKNKLDNKTVVMDNASSADIHEDVLETVDIQQLEAQLSAENQVVYIDFLYQWLMRQVKQYTSGVFVLQSERGMGKSTFCRTIDQLSKSENVRWYTDDLDGWTEFMESTAVRVWYFNSSYYGRKDIYLKGIKDVLLTLEPGYLENEMWIEQNHLVGNLESMWGNLTVCSEDLRKLYFAEALNLTAGEYFKRTNKNKLLLVLDGLDEMKEGRTLLSFIPSPEDLNPNVYLLITCRTDDEIAPELAKGISGGVCTTKLIFKRNGILEIGQARNVTGKNETYHRAITAYTERSVAGLGSKIHMESAEIIERFESRFSELSAYFSLCQLNPGFCTLRDVDFLQAFLEVVKNNSTNAYYSKVLLILNTLAWCGDSLNLRELAFLSGEGYVSFRFLGILNDLRAFIKVSRTDRGNCYEFSHNEWEESVKKRFSSGGIEFRMRCDKLLDCLDELCLENRTEDILLDIYEGERWLFTHMLSIYVRDWPELKENRFEHLSVNKLECFAEKLITHSSDSTKEVLVREIDFRDFYQDYSRVLELYGSGRVNSKMQVSCQTNPLLVTIAELYHFLAIDGKISHSRDHRRYMEIAGYLWHSLSSLSDSAEEASAFREKMIEVNNELYRLNSESDDIEERGLALYKRGRVFQLQENDKKALEMFILFIEEADRYQKDLSLNMRRYYCRAYIRAAHLLMKLDGDASSIEYYLRLADEKTNVLIETVESIDSLSTKAFYEEICAEYNKKINNSAQEMFHLENAIELCNRMLRRKNDRSYLNSKYRFLNRIYDIQVAMAEYDDALHTIEHMVDLDIILHDKCEISTLRKKYELYQT